MWLGLYPQRSLLFFKPKWYPSVTLTKTHTKKDFLLLRTHEKRRSIEEIAPTCFDSTMSRKFPSTVPVACQDEHITSKLHNNSSCSHSCRGVAAGCQGGDPTLLCVMKQDTASQTFLFASMYSMVAKGMPRILFYKPTHTQSRTHAVRRPWQGWA